MKPIVLVGGESTGKSTLARFLGEWLQVPVSLEFSAQYARDIYPRLIQKEDVPVMIEGQAGFHKKALSLCQAQNKPFFIADTDLVSTFVYAEAHYEINWPSLNALVLENKGFLYFLISPEGVAFEPCLTRIGALDREKMFLDFKKALERFQLSYDLLEQPDFYERVKKVCEVLQGQGFVIRAPSKEECLKVCDKLSLFSGASET